jgi:ferredoxin
MENIITITIIDRNEVPHTLEVPTDMSLNLMEVCKAEGLPVEGTCGGMALCATCQVYVQTPQHVGERNDDEELMLDQAFYVLPNSRLGCQLKMTEALDGLVVRLAPIAE